MTTMMTHHHSKPISEAEIQKAIFDALVALGFLVLRINSGRKGQVAFVRWQACGLETQTTGVSDLLALSPTGRFYAIECKAPGEQAKTHQSTFLDEAEKRGAVPIVADDLEALLKQL
jgi:hypothetical protein